MKFRGLSVIELLVVLVIIVLLVALLLPVVWNVRKRATISPCMANMRQIYVAWSNYLHDWDGNPPALPLLVKDAQAVFACPADPYPNGANPRVRRFAGVRGSYFYLFDTPNVSRTGYSLLKDLQEADPNHGILVCVVHGQRISEPVGSAWSDFLGLTLRLRRDGSIQQVRQTARCDNQGNRSRCLWDLMTDNRTHPARLNWGCRNADWIPCE